LVWVDRQSQEEVLPFAPQFYGAFQLSPDGSRAAITISVTTKDIWVYDLVRGSRSRLTRQGNNSIPVWTPDGKKIAFASDRNGVLSMFLKSVTGRGEAEQLSETKFSEPFSWSPDGRTLAFTVTTSDSARGIWLMHLEGDRTPQLFLGTPFVEWGPRFSPDGRYIAYTSDESGQSETYVEPYPRTGERWQISNGGGEEPVWSPASNEIFYSNGPLWMAVTFKTQPRFEVITRSDMFSGPYLNVHGFGYDVSPDGKRFLLIKDSGVRTVQQINVVVNWFKELKRLIPDK